MTETKALARVSDADAAAIHAANQQWLETVRAAGLSPFTVLSACATLAGMVARGWSDTQGTDGHLAIGAALMGDRQRRALEQTEPAGSA